MYVFYTDGACAVHTTKCGGIGIIGYKNDIPMNTRHDHYCNTTNNRMELEAAIVALHSVPPASMVTILTDSMYVVGSVNSGWYIKTNLDLWNDFWCLYRQRYVTMIHCPRDSQVDQTRADKASKAGLNEKKHCLRR